MGVFFRKNLLKTILSAFAEPYLKPTFSIVLDRFRTHPSTFYCHVLCLGSQTYVLSVLCVASSFVSHQHISCSVKTSFLQQEACAPFCVCQLMSQTPAIVLSSKQRCLGPFLARKSPTDSCTRIRFLSVDHATRVLLERRAGRAWGGVNGQRVHD